jgi:hypothetical protein
MDDSRRVWAVVAALVLLSLGVSVLARAPGPRAAAAAAEPADGAWKVTPARRAAGPRFDAAVSAADQAWIRAAIAQARPEARPLIDEIDGYVTFSTVDSGDYLGLTLPSPDGTPIVLNVGYLDRDRTVDRNQTVLHELGHVIDAALIDPAMDASLEAGIPRAGTCAESAGVPIGACAKPNERFADTFAKWALRGAVSVTGGGYGVPMPPSLETWGAPLTALGVEVSQRG